MLALLAIVILLLFFMSVGAPPPAILFGVLFVGFWVVVLKVLISLGRWLIGEPPPRDRRRVRVARPAPPVRYATATHMCPDPRCGRINVREARFCAQCGRPLGTAPARGGLDSADGKAA